MRGLLVITLHPAKLSEKGASDKGWLMLAGCGLMDVADVAHHFDPFCGETTALWW
jgi:hypothetical protein